MGSIERYFCHLNYWVLQQILSGTFVPENAGNMPKNAGNTPKYARIVKIDHESSRNQT